MQLGAGLSPQILGFTRVKGQRLKSAEARGAQGSVQEEPGASFQGSQERTRHLVRPETT